MKKVIIVAILSTAFGCDGTTKDAENLNTVAGTHTVHTPSPSSTAVPSPITTPTDEAKVLTADFAGTAGIIDKKAAASDVVVVKNIRTGTHNGFDRIVFEFEGTELPGYHLEYIDKPVRACGSGDVVALAGDAWLQMRFEPARAHTEEGKATLSFRELTPRYTNLLELKSTCDFEAQVEWVAGVGSPEKYRVLELKNPTRLAVDIKHK